MIEKAELEKLDNDTLKQFAADAGVEFTDATSREALIEATNIAVNGPPEELEGDDAPEATEQASDQAGPPAEGAGDAPQPILAPEAKPIDADWPKSPQQVLDALRGHISRGLQVTFTDSQTCWQLDLGVKQSSGTMKMPLRQIVAQAGLLFVKTSAPVEGDDFDEITNLRYKQLKKAR